MCRPLQVVSLRNEFCQGACSSSNFFQAFSRLRKKFLRKFQEIFLRIMDKSWFRLCSDVWVLKNPVSFFLNHLLVINFSQLIQFLANSVILIKLCNSKVISVLIFLHNSLAVWFLPRSTSSAAPQSHQSLPVISNFVHSSPLSTIAWCAK